MGRRNSRAWSIQHKQLKQKRNEKSFRFLCLAYLPLLLSYRSENTTKVNVFVLLLPVLAFILLCGAAFLVILMLFFMPLAEKTKL